METGCRRPFCMADIILVIAIFASKKIQNFQQKFIGLILEEGLFPDFQV